MPCQLPAPVENVTDDTISLLCTLAMEKCSKKSEKKKASCGGAAMRKRYIFCQVDFKENRFSVGFYRVAMSDK
jgi:hypothetical protein